MPLLRSLCFLFAILTIVVQINGQNDYCNICRDHTMCRFTSPQNACNARVASLTSAQQNEIVNVHNEFRQRVATGNERRGSPGPQPRARNMPNMIWDLEIANVAQRWANRCTFGHDTCRNVRRFGVGQNVAMAWTTGSNPSSIRDLITMWYDEVAQFSPNQISPFRFTGETGHYSQMLWATSTRVGCGYVNYMNGNQNTVLLVCNYGPGGNVIGGTMYERA
ncbi:venom allergen 3-like [Leptopilina heterotoma]|uniref:venom allergen 3-like n=1 Tax=Leptopilina heterotoma TaxID=63436 RepID=UPI001CA86A12|nr:venom allergen 3-like [Leptopilina heterotoma]